MEKNALLFWRIILAIVFALIASIILGTGFKYIPIIGIVGYFTSYPFLKDKQVEDIANYILTDNFGVWLKFTYKCLMLNLGVSLFSTLIVLAGYYKNKPEYDIAVMFYLFFSFYWLLIFLVKKYTNKKIPICDTDDDK